MLKIERNRFSRGLHWTTVASEKLLLALIGGAALYASLNYVYDMFLSRQVELADLFMMFIYVEVIGMVGAFYSTSRIPVTLPIIIAITALCRLIVLHSKEMEPMTLIAESVAIAVLTGSAYLMSLKDKMSLEKLRLRDEE